MLKLLAKSRHVFQLSLRGRDHLPVYEAKAIVELPQSRHLAFLPYACSKGLIPVLYNFGAHSVTTHYK
jgi:hypothetical protein